MDRKEELIKLTNGLDEPVKIVIINLIDDITFIEAKLMELRCYPFIEVNPKNPSQQRSTPAAKMYKEFLQQYNNCIKVMLSALGKSETTEDSPLREYLKRLKKNE